MTLAPRGRARGGLDRGCHLPATRERARAERGPRRERRGGNEAEHARARSHRGGIQVGRAPDAAVNIVPAADPHRPEEPRHRARGSDRVGDLRGRRARGAEHDAVPAAQVHRHHPARPSKRGPISAIRARRASSGRRPGGSRARSAARANSLPGRAARSAAPATGRTASSKAGRAAETACAPRPPGPVVPALPALPALPGLPGRPAGGFARAPGQTPAASRAATIEPAEVPTKHPACRKSAPLRCATPARKPDIHASPRTPPTPSTSTSGGWGAFTPAECNCRRPGPGPRGFRQDLWPVAAGFRRDLRLYRGHARVIVRTLGDRFPET